MEIKILKKISMQTRNVLAIRDGVVQLKEKSKAKNEKKTFYQIKWSEP